MFHLYDYIIDLIGECQIQKKGGESIGVKWKLGNISYRQKFNPCKHIASAGFYCYTNLN